MTDYAAVVYRPDFQTQRVASNLDRYAKKNCAAYSMAMGIDFSTLGGVVISGREIRARSSEPVPDPRSPGLNLSQVLTVARKFGVVFTYREGTFKQALAESNQYRGIIIPGDYDQMGSYSALPSFRDDHMMWWNNPSGNDEELLIFDPLRMSPRWMDTDIIRKYAEKFGSRVVGRGKIQWGVSRRIPLVAVSRS